MLDKLFWRCPLCATNDVVIHTKRFLAADWVLCNNCEARWRMRRVMGDNYYLKIVQKPQEQGDFCIGDEYSLPIWYDAMKASIRLQPLVSSDIQLGDGEVLYAMSRAVEMVAEETDTRFFPEQMNDSSPQAKDQIEGVSLEPGRLFLTNQRLIWQAISSSDDRVPCTVSLPINEINFASTFFGPGAQC